MEGTSFVQIQWPNDVNVILYSLYVVLVILEYLCLRIDCMKGKNPVLWFSPCKMHSFKSYFMWVVASMASKGTFITSGKGTFITSGLFSRSGSLFTSHLVLVFHLFDVFPHQMTHVLNFFQPTNKIYTEVNNAVTNPSDSQWKTPGIYSASRIYGMYVF